MLIVNYLDLNEIGKIDEDVPFDYLPRIGDTIFYKERQFIVSQVTFFEDQGTVRANNITLSSV
jgi:hypothetical protein